MGLSPIQSLKSFASNQPPLLVFTVCLMAFGITMVILAYIIGENDFPNPDVTMDWNVFMERFTELELCVHHPELIENKQPSWMPFATDLSIRNDTNLTHSFHLLSPNAKTVDRSKSMSALLPDIGGKYDEDDNTGIPTNITVSVFVPMHLSIVMKNYPSIILSMMLYGRHLGISGKAADEQLNVVLGLPEKYNVTNCQSDQACEITSYVCLTLHGSSHLLPQTRRPPVCQTNGLLQSNHVKVSLREKDDNKYWCKKGTPLSLGYKPDSQLRVMLSNKDRSLVNLHLMHTSCFLFVMVITLFCFALIRGRYNTAESTIAEKGSFRRLNCP